jgi:hypothetical protein
MAQVAASGSGAGDLGHDAVGLRRSGYGNAPQSSPYDCARADRLSKTLIQ